MLEAFQNKLESFIKRKGLVRIMTEPWLPPFLSIAVSGFVLGTVFTLCLMWFFLYAIGSIESIAWVGLGAYLLFGFVMFHASEFACAILFRPHDCSPDSFLFFHSYAWIIAHTCAWLELFIRFFFVAATAQDQWNLPRIIIGSILCIFFYWFRVQAMVDCGSNFSFQIETSHRTTHQLVTTGIYSKLRHPSYFGSFWYFLSVQLIAGNWVCFVLFFFVLRFFFSDRIAGEEEILESEEFFGEKYKEYKKSSWIGIPVLNTPPFFA